MNKTNPQISPSILASDFANLGNVIKATSQAEAKYVHLDVMDGTFVPNITFGAPIISALQPYKSNLLFDTHLMINEPIKYLENFAKSGSNLITIHAEACKNVIATLKEIKNLGCTPGISIKPNTPVEEIIQYKEYFELILIMSVEPGFGGQSFIPKSIEKIKSAKKYFPEKLISVDGGVNISNAQIIIEAGANILVAGSAVYKKNNRYEAKEIRQAIKELIT